MVDGPQIRAAVLRGLDKEEKLMGITHFSKVRCKILNLRHNTTYCQRLGKGWLGKSEEKDPGNHQLSYQCSHAYKPQNSFSIKHHIVVLLGSFLPADIEWVTSSLSEAKVSSNKQYFVVDT